MDRFVNLQHPDDLKTEEMQLRIRRLAMTEVGKARRKPKTKRARNEIVLEFRDPSCVTIDRFGGGQFDPTNPYPIELDDSARALLANVFSTQNNNHPSQLRGSWYPVGLSDAAAFHNMLANSQNFLFQKRHGYFPSQDDAVALKHHHKALRHTTSIMKDPTKYKSDEVICGVVSFMIHNAFLGDFTHWQKHSNALVRIVNLRGGYQSITRDHLRITVSWADLIGSFYQDQPPIVPMPQQWIAYSRSPPNSPRPTKNSISLTWKQQLPMHLDWITIFDDIVQLISLDQAFSEKQSTLATTSGSWMEPTLYRLLAIRPSSHQEGNNANRGKTIEEVCRLGTLLFLSPFWRALGQSPVRTSALSRNLLLVLTKTLVEWNELKPLLIWVMYFAAIETQDLAERSQFVFMLGMLMSGMRLSEWDDIMDIVKSVLWVDKLFAGTDDLIRDEVMQIVNHNPMSLLSFVADTPPVPWEDFGVEG
ncbi:tachykinin family [Pyrenophora seminiperda CCB06]|uniref:Tachykinin family n=1 Tax=Pyrenophora seminiperda CCB06 TaxID=1302712 RepID=A0A3M7M1A0_9PLEO|nr:tachykinin family [Pyrenophora seminiperda CCB06]